MSGKSEEQKQPVFATFGRWDDYHTMAEIVDAARGVLAHIALTNPPAGMRTVLEVPRNMTQADVDKLCRANANCVTIERTGRAV